MPNQACRRPQPIDATLPCLLGTLLRSTLMLDGLFEAAAARQSPAMASAWVHRHLSGALMRSSAAMTRTIAEQYRSAQPWVQQVNGTTCSGTSKRFLY